MIPSDLAMASASFARFRRLGWNPVPSRSDDKAPKVPYREFWATPGPDWWAGVPCRNVQVMTGAAWRLAVLDLDGPTAIEVFRSWALYRDTPPTWESAHTPGKGRHLWYTLPAGLAAFPSRYAWELAGAKHEAIEILGDGKLAVAPPSIHPRSRRRYRWLHGRSPLSIARPAEMPGWMIGLPDVRSRPKPVASPIRTKSVTSTKWSVEHYRSREVLDAIPDKVALAASWGLRFTGRSANGAGWLQCHAVGREDRSPSAGFNERSGYYCEPAANLRLSLFDLAAELGAYASWDEARDDLGGRYCRGNP